MGQLVGTRVLEIEGIVKRAEGVETVLCLVEKADGL